MDHRHGRFRRSAAGRWTEGAPFPATCRDLSAISSQDSPSFMRDFFGKCLRMILDSTMTRLWHEYLHYFSSVFHKIYEDLVAPSAVAASISFASLRATRRSSVEHVVYSDPLVMSYCGYKKGP